jgi:hypothetical protein
MLYNTELSLIIFNLINLPIQKFHSALLLSSTQFRNNIGEDTLTKKHRGKTRRWKGTIIVIVRDNQRNTALHEACRNIYYQKVSLDIVQQLVRSAGAEEGLPYR